MRKYSTISDDSILIRRKLAKAKMSRRVSFVDLFAGSGGLSLGFDRAGFHCVGGVELDKDARETHRKNFSTRCPEGYGVADDITTTAPADLVAHISGVRTDEKVDIVIGGPPCQAFSRLGRAALWRLAEERGAHLTDPRAELYAHFLHYIQVLKPLAFVMENVKEIGRFGGRNVAHEIAVTAESLGYVVRYALLNSVWYGVPQFRERMIIIGVHKALGINPAFPPIKYVCPIPAGYTTSRAGRRIPYVLPPDDLFEDHHGLSSTVYKAHTAQDALSDLPEIFHHLDGRQGKGLVRQPYRTIPYRHEAHTKYLREMREWPGFFSDIETDGHVIRYTPRDYDIFRRMEAGDQYPQALRVAEELFQERIAAYEQVSGKPVLPGSDTWNAIRKSSVPPYAVGRYPNKFQKLRPDEPARTLPAHLGKDSYSHIHFDSNQARTISVREAARLQSFPDGFRFVGSMNSQFRQIGNAVPPLMAYAIAQTLHQILISADNTWTDVAENLYEYLF